MSIVSLCTPVSNNSSKCLSFLNEFFYYGHYKYTVLTHAQQDLQIGKSKQHQSGGKIFLKVALLFTGLAPLIAGIYRLTQHKKWSAYKNVTIVVDSKISLPKPMKSNPKLEKDILALKDGKMTLQEYAKKHKDWVTLLKNRGSEITKLNLRDFINLKEALENLKHCPNLEKLRLNGATLTSEHIKQLAALPLTKLEYLSLIRDLSQTRQITGSDIAVLVASPLMQSVTSLILLGQQCSGEAMQAIAESQYLKQLTVLEVNMCGLDDHGMELLVNSENITNIVSLDVSNNDLTMKAAQSIAHSDKLHNLKYLHMEYNSLECAGAMVLANATNLDQLEELDIQFNHCSYDQIDNLRGMFKPSLKVSV